MGGAGYPKLGREIPERDGAGPRRSTASSGFGVFAFPQTPCKNTFVPLWFITMPSDLAKKKAAKKKEAAKARQRPRKGHEENGDTVTEPQVAEEKSEANGRETTGELREMRVPGMVATT